MSGETARQPRVMMELPGIIDEQTANVVEDFWIDDATLEVVGQLITGEPMIHSMMMMCSPPVEDHPGGTGWHRDFSALRTAPLAALQADLIENGAAVYAVECPALRRQRPVDRAWQSSASEYAGGRRLAAPAAPRSRCPAA